MGDLSIRFIATSALIAAALAGTLFMAGYQDIHYAPALAGILGGLVLCLSARGAAIPVSGAAMGVYALWTVAALSLAFSTIPFTSQIAFVIFSAFPLCFLIAAQMPERIMPALACAMALFLTGLSGTAMIHSFIGDVAFLHRASWPFQNPNLLAATLNPIILVCAGITLSAKDRRTVMLFGGAAFIGFMGLVATGSRGGMLSLLLPLTLLMLLLREDSRRTMILLGTGIAIAVLYPLASRSPLWPGTVELVTNPAIGSVTDRLALWRGAWQMMMDHPLIGTGIGTFSFYYSAVRAPMSDQSPGYFAHFDSLQMGAEMGVLAPVLFYTILIAVLIRTIEAVLQSNPADRARILIPFLALLSIAIHAHICFPLFLMPVLMMCGMLLGVWHTATVRVLNHGSATLTKPWLGTAGSLVTAIILLGLAVPAALGSFYMKASLTAGDARTYLERLAKADRYGPPGFIDPQVELARANLRLLAGAQISPAMRDHTLEETETLLDVASQWNPAWAEIELLRGRLYEQKGDTYAAIHAYNEALVRDVMNETARRALARMLWQDGQKEKALGIVQNGLGYPHRREYQLWAVDFLQNGP